MSVEIGLHNRRVPQALGSDVGGKGYWVFRHLLGVSGIGCLNTLSPYPPPPTSESSACGGFASPIVSHSQHVTCSFGLQANKLVLNVFVCVFFRVNPTPPPLLVTIWCP